MCIGGMPVPVQENVNAWGCNNAVEWSADNRCGQLHVVDEGNFFTDRSATEGHISDQRRNTKDLCYQGGSRKRH